jgi:hypothetical protein
MREQILRQFFEGTSSASELARDVCGSTRQANQKLKITSIENMEVDFDVTAGMAVRLCDAVLSCDLPATALQTIGFALTASDKFQWGGDEDDVLASVIADWSCPEINYPLTLENVQRFRAWLTRAEEYPPKPSRTENSGGKLISVTEKETIRPVKSR